MHGGYGMASRTHGLTLDWLTGAKVVLANGSLVHCSATENQDLFWALRGAGSSFGIVGEFEFNTFRAPDHVTIAAMRLSWNETDAAHGIKALQDLVISAPKELNVMMFMAATHQSIHMLYFGGSEGLHKATKPFTERVRIQSLHTKTMSWMDGLQHFAFGQSLVKTAQHDQVC